ncbi:MAG: Ig-like domain-containing protein [Gammaproteobacteria bacterium]|nr:Ig-like domain-containing protein [Gammaproteobacteria bacterium]
MATTLVACNIGSYDDAVRRYNENAPPPPPPPPPAGFGPNFSEIQTNIFTPTCATSNCHSAAAAQAGLNLETASSYAALYAIASSQQPAVQRVNPGNPGMSYLIQKLEGAAGISGGQMPPGGALPQAQIDVIRQWIAQGAIDDTVPSSNPIRVTSLSPAPGAALTVAPAQIIAGFDREPTAATINATTFILERSNNDMTFDDGDDIAIMAAVPPAVGATPQSAVFDLSGVALADDTYRIRLLGTGNFIIQDLDANALDGEYLGTFPSGDGTAGGDFAAQFTLSTPVVIGPTLDQIQAVVFTPQCASCHGGGNPSGSLDLSDADTSHMQLVGIPSSGQAGATRVIIMDPDNSYLIQKLENAPGIAGGQMPPGQALPQSDIDEIRQWILDGALR